MLLVATGFGDVLLLKVIIPSLQLLIKEEIKERRKNFPSHAEKNHARRKRGLGRAGNQERQTVEIEGHPTCQ